MVKGWSKSGMVPFLCHEHETEGVDVEILGLPTNGEELGAMAPNSGLPNGCSSWTTNLETME